MPFFLCSFTYKIQVNYIFWTICNGMYRLLAGGGSCWSWLWFSLAAVASHQGISHVKLKRYFWAAPAVPINFLSVATELVFQPEFSWPQGPQKVGQIILQYIHNPMNRLTL